MVRFQELIKNWFLTLHGHNLHYQQRKGSKFLMHYQMFTSHAHCGAAGPVSKMASQQEKAFCVLRFEVSRSVITVQRAPLFYVCPVYWLYITCFGIRAIISLHNHKISSDWKYLKLITIRKEKFGSFKTFWKLLRIEDATWLAWRIPTAVTSIF
jgi:hypothetical protein